MKPESVRVVSPYCLPALSETRKEIAILEEVPQLLIPSLADIGPYLLAVLAEGPLNLNEACDVENIAVGLATLVTEASVRMWAAEDSSLGQRSCFTWSPSVQFRPIIDCRVAVLRELSSMMAATFWGTNFAAPVPPYLHAHRPGLHPRRHGLNGPREPFD